MGVTRNLYSAFDMMVLPVPVAAQSKARSLWPLEHWGRGFESRSRHECVSAFFCVVLSCVGSGLAMGRSTVQGVLPGVQK